MGGRTGFSRRNFLGAAAGGAALASLPRWLAAEDKGMKQPNIVYILADDLGYGDISCLNAQSKIPTPSIDQLAAAGMIFTDAHSSSAVCTPTRYGVLTGRYCWRTRLKKGVLGGYSPPLIEPGRVTVASLLKQQGYTTGCVGKWHLGLGWPLKDGEQFSDAIKAAANVDFTKPLTDSPVTHGFDYYYGIAASLDMPPYTYIENDRVVTVPAEQGTAKEFGRAGLKAAGFTAEGVLPDLTKKAVEFIDRSAKGGKPFFLYFPSNAPHTPVAPTDDVKGKSRAGSYGDFVAEFDWSVGEVMKALERNGIADNTLLVVTSDNGSSPHGFPLAEEEKYDHRTSYVFRGRKSDAWDGGHHIPFIARWPGKVKAGTRSDEIVCLNDLLATCAALTAAKLPDDAGEDSYNILPALLSEKLEKAIREATVHHSINGEFAIRQGKWKLITCPGSGGWSGPKPKPGDPPIQLYDMSADASEKQNVCDKHPEVVKQLRALLEKYKAEGRSRPKG